MKRLVASIGALSVVAIAGCGGGGASKTATQHAVSQAPFVFQVADQSMEPALRLGAQVTVRPTAPKVGAIAVFYPPEGGFEPECGPTPHPIFSGGAACQAPIPKEGKVKVVKRIVAGAGDEIYVRAGEVYRKPPGAAGFLRESGGIPHPCSGARCNFPTPITIPAGHWFMVGDNRGPSADSRVYGPVPTAWIAGIVSLAPSSSTG
jgi:signal peptidase I